LVTHHFSPVNPWVSQNQSVILSFGFLLPKGFLRPFSSKKNPFLGKGFPSILAIGDWHWVPGWLHYPEKTLGYWFFFPKGCGRKPLLPQRKPLGRFWPPKRFLGLRGPLGRPFTFKGKSHKGVILSRFLLFGTPFFLPFWNPLVLTSPNWGLTYLGGVEAFFSHFLFPPFWGIGGVGNVKGVFFRAAGSLLILNFPGGRFFSPKF